MPEPEPVVEPDPAPEPVPVPAIEPEPEPEPVPVPGPEQPVATAEPVATPEPTMAASPPSLPTPTPEVPTVAPPVPPATASTVAPFSKSSPLPLPGVPPGAFELNNLNGTGVADGCATQCWNTVEWYEWVSPTTGTMLIRAKSINGWDNTLEVWLDGTTLLVQNDDAYGLDAQVVFDVQAGARYVVGLGGYTPSSQGVAIVTFLTGAPTVPSAVTATAAPGQASVTWAAPDASGESVSEFRVRRFLDGIQEGGYTSVSGFPPATSLLVTGLTDYRTYTFTVSAVNALGESAQSAPSNPVVPRPPLSPPVQMAAPAAAPAGAHIAVTWQASTADELTEYRLWRYRDGTQDGAPVAYPLSALSASVAGLVPGGSYTFRIQAVNPAGESPLSDASNAVVAATVPGRVTGVSAQADSATTATVTWTAPNSDGGAAITGYRATADPGGRTCEAAGSATTCLLTGLQPGQAQTVTVVAINAVGSSAASMPSAPFTPVGPPTAPGRPELSRDGPGALLAQWTVPSSDGGLAITGYTVTAAPGGAQCSTGAAAQQCRLAGLTNGQPYTVMVTAKNAEGTSPASPVSAAEFPQGPPTAPGAPDLTRAGPGELRATWAAPASDEGAAITGYTVTATPGGATCTAAPGELTCLLTGLSNGTPYTATVMAANLIGESPASVPSAAEFPQGPPTAPGRPSVLAAGAGQARVTWTPPTSNEGSALVGYLATATPGGAQCGAATDATECVLTGLTDGREYTVTVRARNGVGLSPPSPESGAYVQQTPGRADVTIAFDGAIGTEAGQMTVTAAGGGLKAFSQATFTVFSTPQVVGAAPVSRDGSFTGTATLPADLAPGSHRFVVTGVDPADAPRCRSSST